jgi:type II restriction enzyme
MNLNFHEVTPDAIKGPTQKAKLMTERWFRQEGYCPACGSIAIHQYPPNRPVADFFCQDCNEDYELKSLRVPLGPKVPDGAYRTMIERLNSATNPSLLLLHYDKMKLSVQNLIVVPKYYFTPSIILQRKPLSQSARRAGWVGCNILIRDIPDAGRISLVRNQIVIPRERVVANWSKTKFLQTQKNVEGKGWLLAVMKCIEELNSSVFNLDQCYGFEQKLMALYPSNNSIRPKIRQKLQVMRDNGFLEFLGNGVYRLKNTGENG